MSGWQELALIAVTATAAWWAGRTLAPRIPPWRRMPVGLGVLVGVVVLLITINFTWHLLPREVLRLCLMFTAFSWVIGIFGYRDQETE